MKPDRKWSGVLYPDAENYDCSEVLASIADYFDEWAYVLHNRDKNEDGTLKKPHYHWVGRCPTARQLEAVANKLGVPDRDIEPVRVFKSLVRYLIHLDDTDKVQYSRDEVLSNMDLSKFFGQTSDEMARSIFTEIVRNKNTSVVALCHWALENGQWSEFRRGFPVWQSLINEMKGFE